MGNAAPVASESKFDYWRKTIGLFLGPIAAIVVYFTPIAGLDVLGTGAHELLAVMTLVCIWWVCEPVPMAITSIVGPLLCIVLGIATASDALSSFSNPTIAVFLGGFMIAGGITLSGLDKRIAFAILRMKWVGGSPFRIMVAFGGATALLSGWISNTACCAMMFPIAMGLLEVMREALAAQGRDFKLEKSKYACGLLLMCAYASSIGGVLTPIGTPPNLLTIGFLADAGFHITFFEWMIWGFVCMVGYFIIAVLVLHFLFPSEVKQIEGAQDLFRKKQEELGPWTRLQKLVLVAFGVAVFLWVAPGIVGTIAGTESDIYLFLKARLPESAVALIGAVLLFLLPTSWGKRTFCITWKEAEKSVDWGTLLLFGGGLALGSLMFSTGLSEWLGMHIISLMGGNPSYPLFIAVFAAAVLLFSEVCSHTSTINMLCPLAISSALALGFNPVPVAVGMALASSIGCMLPVCTPPNAIVYGSGLVPLPKMVKSGFIIDAIGIAVVVIPVAVFLVANITA